MKGHLLVGSSPLALIPKIMNEIEGRRVLDVGCGCGVYGYLLRNKWQDTPAGSMQFSNFAGRDVSNDQPELLVGIDVQTENLRRCAWHRIYDSLALCSAHNLPFPDNYVDTIVCVEVLEHLTKEDALTAIRGFERVARQRIVITVPKLAVNPTTGEDDRPFLNLDSEDPDVREWVEAETHKCGFTIDELKQLGFRVGGRRGRGWRKPLVATLRLWETHNPRTGWILAVKELDKGVASCRTDGVLEPPKRTEDFPDYR